MKREFLLSRFTPSLLEHRTLEAIFVQREDLAARMTALIRESATTSNKHYCLLVGPRGIGKTHLVSLVYHRIREDRELEERLRIAWLREEEWGIASYTDFLLCVLRATDENHPELKLAADYEKLFDLSADEAEAAAERLLLKTVKGRTLLVIAENLDEIFGGLGREGQEKLRGFIQSNPRFTILATAQSLFGGVSTRSWPFYGFFETHHLRDLSFEDVVLLLEKIARLEGDEAIAELLQTPQGRARIRAVDHLAGGNPRVYIIFSQFLTRENLDQLVDPLMQTLDDLTPYYQSRMAFLSPQQRKIVEYLCDQRHAVTVSDIARRNFLTHQTASSQLRKLRELGYVRAHQVGRESYYELREPLMRLSLEVKKLRGGPIRFFVEFLKLWYSHAELEQRLNALEPTEASEREYLTQAIKAQEEEADDPHIRACLEDYDKYRRQADFERALKVSQELIVLRKTPLDSLRLATCLLITGRGAESPKAERQAIDRGATGQDWRIYGDGLDNNGLHDDALRAYDEAERLSPLDSALWNNRGVCLSHLKRIEEKLACYERATALDPRNTLAWYNKALTLKELGRNQDALNAYRKVIELEAVDATDWIRKGHALRNLKRNDEALQAFDKAIELAPEDTDTWREKAYALWEDGSYEKALGFFDKALEIDSQDVFSFRGRAEMLSRLERYEEALAACDRALRIDDRATYSWSLRGCTLLELYRPKEALEAFDRALEVDPDSAFALGGRVVSLYRLGRLKKSLSCLDQIIEIDPQSAGAWSNRGVALSGLGRFEEALESFDKSLELDAEEAPFQVHSNRSVALIGLRRIDEGVRELERALVYLKDAGGVDPGGDIAIVRNMLVRTRDEGVWRYFIELWLRAFGEQGLLSALGHGLVESVLMLSIDWIGDEVGKRWCGIWEELGAPHEELQIPLRMVRAAVDYGESHDQRVLLRLPLEERKVLESLLQLPVS